MGYEISWIGFRGIDKTEVLKAIGAIDTEVSDRARRAPLLGAEIPQEWFILFANDIDYPTEHLLASLSTNCTVVACQVHEGIMVSTACGYRNGYEEWRLIHNSENGIRHLAVLGAPPGVFPAIRDRLATEQDTHEAKSLFNIDYFFDVPLETAAALCGYRHDRWKFDWGEPNFTILEVR